MNDLRRRLARLALGATALAAGGACIRGTLPAREIFRLSLPSLSADGGGALDTASRLAALGGTLAVAPYLTPGLYGDRNIVYRVNDTEYGTYPSREWAIPLGEMLGVSTEASFRRHPLTREPAVFDPPSSRTAEYMWQGTVREFEEVDRGRTVSASVRLDALLLRTRDDSVLWKGSVQLERPVPPPTTDMNNVVQTLSALSTEAIQRLTSSADSAIRAGAARRATSPP